MPRKLSWKKTPPTQEGYYWYRDKDRSVILHVTEPHAKGHWKTWDWQGGRLNLYPIADYPGEWYGPLEEPR